MPTEFGITSAADQAEQDANKAAEALMDACPYMLDYDEALAMLSILEKKGWALLSPNVLWYVKEKHPYPQHCQHCGRSFQVDGEDMKRWEAAKAPVRCGNCKEEERREKTT